MARSQKTKCHLRVTKNTDNEPGHRSKLVTRRKWRSDTHIDAPLPPSLSVSFFCVSYTFSCSVRCSLFYVFVIFFFLCFAPSLFFSSIFVSFLFFIFFSLFYFILSFLFFLLVLLFILLSFSMSSSFPSSSFLDSFNFFSLFLYFCAFLLLLLRFLSPIISFFFFVFLF